MAHDWMKEPPADWERRLREISPVTDTLAHLRFRWREPQAHWLIPDQGQWEIYSCTPRQMVTADRAAQFRTHWADLPKGKQAGRKAFVTTYQFHMWHQHGVDAQRFWVLQGPWGGTPAEYTERERRILDAEGMVSEPIPFGTLAACPFDEQSVAGILSRDRLLKYDKNVDALARSNSPEAQAALTDQAEREFRDRFLDFWYERTAPQAEFLKSYLRTTEADMGLRKATREEADAVSQWKEHFREYGTVIGAQTAGSRKIQVAVR